MTLTRQLARYAVESRFEALPQAVQHEAARAFLNWVGVTLGGSAEDASRIAARFVASEGATPVSSVIGHGFRTSIASAAFVNCIASSVLAYDDAHLPTVAHPSGPAAAAVFALAQARAVSGAEFLNALALGIEVQCRVANMLSLPPAPMNPKFYVNGFSGPIGVAAAVGRLIRLDEQQMRWAIGTAASQASGFRAAHGTMNSHFRPGSSTRAGVVAALMAEMGFDCIENALEVDGGFIDVYAPGSDPEMALAGLGEHHEMLANRYKAYPCGIVVPPTIDACREIRARIPAGAAIARVELAVNPLVLTLTGKREPRTTIEAGISVYHWAAAALLCDQLGLDTPEAACVADPAIAELRGRIEAEARPDLGKGEAMAKVTLADGTVLESHVIHARGSLERPLTDGELNTKFADLARVRLGHDAAEALREMCWQVGDLADVGGEIGVLLP